MRNNFLSYRLAVAAVIAAGVFALPGPASAAFSGENGPIVAAKCDSLAVCNTATHLWTVDPSSGQEHQLTSGPEAERHPSFLPGGKRIAFQRCPSGAACRIATIDPNGQNETDLTDGSTGFDDMPSFSPDGSRIVFSRRLNGDVIAHLYVSNSDGSGAKPLTAGSRTESTPAFSPDGSTIVFASSVLGLSTDIYKMPAAGGSWTPLTVTGTSDHPSFSPDGSHIVFTRSVGGVEAVWVMDADGGNQHALSTPGAGANDTRPAFSPDGTKVVFQRKTSGQSQLYVMDADGGNPHPIVASGEVWEKADWGQPLPPAPATGSSTQPVPFHVTLRVPKKESVRKGRLYLFATSNGPATIVAKGRVAVPSLAGSRRLRTSSKALSANSPTKIWLKIPSKPLRAIRTALARHERLKASIAVTVKDGAGNATSQRAAIRLKK